MYFLINSLYNRYDIVKLYEVCNYLTYLTLQSMSVSLERGTRPLVVLYLYNKINFTETQAADRSNKIPKYGGYTVIRGSPTYLQISKKWS